MLVMGVCQRCIENAVKRTGKRRLQWSGVDTIQWYEGFVVCPVEYVEGTLNYRNTKVLSAPPAWCDHGLEHGVIFARTKKYRLKEKKEIEKSMKRKGRGSV